MPRCKKTSKRPVLVGQLRSWYAWSGPRKKRLYLIVGHDDRVEDSYLIMWLSSGELEDYYSDNLIDDEIIADVYEN